MWICRVRSVLQSQRLFYCCALWWQSRPSCGTVVCLSTVISNSHLQCFHIAAWTSRVTSGLQQVGHPFNCGVPMLPGKSWNFSLSFEAWKCVKMVMVIENTGKWVECQWKSLNLILRKMLQLNVHSLSSFQMYVTAEIIDYYLPTRACLWMLINAYFRWIFFVQLVRLLVMLLLFAFPQFCMQKSPRSYRHLQHCWKFACLFNGRGTGVFEFAHQKCTIWLVFLVVQH